MTSRPEALDPDLAPRRRDRSWTLLLIGTGGAVGTLIRFGIESFVPPAANGWPTGTFVINVSGAFLLAMLLETLSLRGGDDGWRRRIRLGVGTGVLGGYTTYSSFMVEAALLGSGGRYLIAFGYVAVSLVLGVVAAWAGVALVGLAHRRGSETRA